MGSKSSVELQHGPRLDHGSNTVGLGNFVPLFNFSLCSMSSISPKRYLNNTYGMQRRSLGVFMVVFDFFKIASSSFFDN